MIRLASRNFFRSFLSLLLSFALIYGPLFGFAPVPAQAATETNPKAVSFVQDVNKPHRAGEVIMKFRPGVPDAQKRQIIDTFAREDKQLRGRGEVTKLKLHNVADTSNAVFNLKQLDAVVEWVEPNYLVASADLKTKRAKKPQANAGIPNDPGFPNQWSLANTGQSNGLPGSDIGALAGWQKTKGSRDIVVAVIDTGVDLRHADLIRNLWKNQAELTGKKNADDDNDGYTDDVSGWNFVSDTSDVSDDQGHGTAMAGIIAAETDNRFGIAGVMWQASIMPLKALDATGSGSIADVVEAIDYAVGHGAQVINCSFGTEGYSQALFDAIQRAATGGVLVVASAGNNAQDISLNPYYPAGYNLSNLVSVAATTNTDYLASFSNWSKEKVQVAAPGVGILTTARGGGFVTVTGTSAAAPIVAGVAGLLKSLRPWVSPPTVRQSLILGSRKVAALDGKVASGGVVYLGSAIEVFLKGGRGDDDPGDTGGGGGGTGGGGTGGGGGGGGQVPPGMLDYIRVNKPKTPEPRVQINLPPGPYDDPEPGGSGGFGNYYYQESLPQNATGRSGAKTGQDSDPTTAKQESINLGSQNVNYVAPVVSLSGRAGLGVNLSLSYNSNTWVKNNTTMVFNTDKGFPGTGWRLGYGAIEGVLTSGSIGAYSDPVSGKNAFIYIEPDGTRHTLAGTGSIYTSYDSSYLEYDNGAKIMKLANGTQITFETPMYQGQAVGRQLLPNQIKDRNGNCIRIKNAEIQNVNQMPNMTHEWGIDFITDTLGRVIDFWYDSNLLTKITQDRGTAGWFDFAVIDYVEVTLTSNFSSPITATDPGGTGAAPNQINGTKVWLPYIITYPTKHNTRFFYTSYGQLYQIERWVPTVANQGTERGVAFTRYDMPTVNGYSVPAGAKALPGANTALTDCPKFATRWEWAENWSPMAASPGWTAYTNGGTTYYVAQYTYSFNTGSNYSTVTDPIGRIYRTDVSTDGLTHTSKVYENLSAYNAGVALKTAEIIYTKDTGPTYTSNQRVASVKLTDGSFTRYTTIGYDTTTIAGVALPNDAAEYQGNTTTIYRHTVTSYNSNTAYSTRHIYGLPFQVFVYKGAGTGNLASKLEYTYDEAAYFDTTGYTLLANVHDTANYGTGFTTGRGNRTTVKQYEVPGTNTRIASNTKYDITGNAVTVYDALGHQTNFYYDNNFDVSPGGEVRAYPTKVKDPDSYWSGAKYEYYYGNPLQQYHIQGTSGTGAIQNRYDSTYDSAGRWTATYRPDGGGATRTYWDNWIVVADYTITSLFGDYRYNFTVYNGAGGLRWYGGDHPNGVLNRYWIKQFQFGFNNFDGSGPLANFTKATNPTEADGNLVPQGDDASTGFRWTATWYDALDRVKRVRLADFAVRDYLYTGCGCAGSNTVRMLDERGKTSEQVYDYLGRLSEARELTVYPWNLMSKAVYTYDERDLLQKIEHFNNGSAKQERFFEYDGYGRLWKQRTPETNLTNYVYAYYADNQVQSVTDPRGVSVSYTYNNRHQPTVVDYSDTTLDVYYGYGEYGERAWMEERNGGAVYGGTYYSYNHAQMKTRLTSEKRNFNGLSGDHLVSYNYNLEDQLTQISYNTIGGGWVRNVNYAYNFMGAPTKIGTDLTTGLTAENVMKNMTFRAFGALKSADYGNTQHIELSYNADRLNPTRMQVYKAGPTPTYIVDKGYDYYNGGANNGRLQKLTDYLDGAFSMVYSYDDYNRLASANSVMANVFTRSYGYDAWGNLTGVTTGGTANPPSQPSYTLNYVNNATGAPATNRINQIQEGPSSYTAVYDAAGNLTSDPSPNAGTYTYDGASRLKTASQAASSYEYDGDGRRVKQATSSATTFYLWSSVLGQPVLELSGGGGITRAYVFSSSGQRVAVYTSSSFYWIHGDHLGSSHKLTDTSGNVVYSAEYDPHGNLRQETGTTTLTTRKFTGYERDGANLDNAQARTFAYKRGRFLQPDPLSLGASDPMSPQSLNLYSYVGNDPINFVDPEGLLMVMVWGMACVSSGAGTTCEYYLLDSYYIPDSAGEPGGQRGGGERGGGQQGGQNTKEIVKCLGKGLLVGAVGALAVGALAVGAVALGAPVAAVTGVLLLAAAVSTFALVVDTGIQKMDGNSAGVAYNVGSLVGGVVAGAIGGGAIANGIKPGATRGWSWASNMAQRYRPSLGSVSDVMGTGPTKMSGGTAAGVAGAGAAIPAKGGC